ncbi:MAG: hypothetical protein ACXVSJ_02760 [Solirubrobacteraceae bacterium]
MTLAFTLDSSAITSSGGPSSVTVQLAAGTLADVAATRQCVAGTTPHYTADCLVGTGSGSDTLKIPLTFTAYLVPPTQPGDIAGVDLVTGKANSKLAHAEVSVAQLTSGGVVADLTIDLSSLGLLTRTITGLTVNINATVNGHPFTRMPSTGQPAAPSVLSVVYGSGPKAMTETTSASPDITPSGASTLRYAPKVHGTVTRDSGDAGVSLTATVMQAADEAASSSAALTIGSGVVSPNLAAAVALLNSGSAVGAASVVSPLIPGALHGRAFLTGSIAAPALTIRFPPPFPLTLVGMINVFNNSFTFSGLPDVPLTKLTVTLNGGSTALLQANCATVNGTLTGGFIGQNGKRAHSQQMLSVIGCPGARRVGAPKLTGGSVSGLETGHARLRFKVTHGVNAPNIASISVGLPRGLSFRHMAVVKHRRCDSRGKCTTMLSVSGLSLSGGSVGAARVEAGRFVVMFKKPAKSVLLTISRPLLAESTALKKKARQHKLKALAMRVRVTDARRHASPMLVRKLKLR